MPPARRTILLIDDEGHFSYQVACCLAKADPNLRLLILSQGVLPYGRASRYVDKCFRFRGRTGKPECVDDIEAVIRREGVDLLFPVDEDGVALVLQNYPRLSQRCKIVRLPTRDAFFRAANKWETFRELDRHQIPVPLTRRCKSDASFDEFEFPVLLKPVHGRRGANIRMLQERPDRELWQTIRSGGIDFLIQEYLEGYDIDCSVLCRDGEILTHTIQQPLGTTNGFSPKIDKLKFLHDPQVLDVTERTMRAFHWDGVAHLDLRYDRRTGGVKVIEINPRYWASLQASHAVGVNFPILHDRLSQGEAVTTMPVRHTHYASLGRFLRDRIRGIRDASLADTELSFLLADPRVALVKFTAGWHKRWCGAKQYISLRHRHKSSSVPSSQLARPSISSVSDSVPTS